MDKALLFGKMKWNPKKIPNCSLWLDAGKITGIADGGAIAQWNDLSGNGNHCTQATGSLQPIYSATGIAGRSEVALTYKDLSATFTRWMAIPAGVSTNEQNMTTAFVGRPIAKTFLSGYAVPICLGTNGVKLGWGPLYTAAVVGSLRDGNALVYHQPHMMGLVCRSTGATVWYDNSTANIAAGSNVTRTGGRLGADTGGNYISYCALSEVVVYSRALTDTEMGKLFNYFKAKYFGNAHTKQVICDGDSLTTGYACINHANYPGQMWASLGRDWKIYNVSVPGQGLTNMQSDAATEIDAYYSAGLNKNVVACWAGVIDLNNGVGVPTTITRLQTYCAARQAAGWKVVVLTCLPSDLATEDDRNAYNASIRANWATYADGIADVAADARLSDKNDPVYFNNSDGFHTHLTKAGFTIVGQITATAIRGL